MHASPRKSALAGSGTELNFTITGGGVRPLWREHADQQIDRIVLELEHGAKREALIESLTKLYPEHAIISRNEKSLLEELISKTHFPDYVVAEIHAYAEFIGRKLTKSERINLLTAAVEITSSLGTRVPDCGDSCVVVRTVRGFKSYAEFCKRELSTEEWSLFLDYIKNIASGKSILNRADTDTINDSLVSFFRERVTKNPTAILRQFCLLSALAENHTPDIVQALRENTGDSRRSAAKSVGRAIAMARHVSRYGCAGSEFSDLASTITSVDRFAADNNLFLTTKGQVAVGALDYFSSNTERLLLRYSQQHGKLPPSQGLVLLSDIARSTSEVTTEIRIGSAPASVVDIILLHHSKTGAQPLSAAICAAYERILSLTIEGRDHFEEDVLNDLFAIEKNRNAVFSADDMQNLAKIVETAGQGYDAFIAISTLRRFQLVTHPALMSSAIIRFFASCTARELTKISECLDALAGNKGSLLRRVDLRGADSDGVSDDTKLLMILHALLKDKVPEKGKIIFSVVNK